MSNKFKPGDEVLYLLHSGRYIAAKFIRYNIFNDTLCSIDFHDNISKEESKIEHIDTRTSGYSSVYRVAF